MVLKGSIGTFDVISIIQMVTSQQVTGVLYIQGKEKKDAFEVWIDNGMIVIAMPELKMPIAYVVERLERAGLISKGQYKVLMDDIKRGDVRYIDISKRFAVPLYMYKRLLLAITYESLHRMYAFKEGTYEFEQKTVEYDRELFQPMNTEFILMETSRILDEVMHSRWKYTDDTVFKKTPSAQSEAIQQGKKEQEKKPEEATEEFVVERSATQITPEGKNTYAETNKTSQEIVLELIDGKRTLKDIYYASLLSRNEVILEINNLLNSGRIVLASKPVEDQFSGKKALLTRVGDTLRASLVLLINVVILITILYYSRINPLNYYGTKIDITYSNLLKYIGKYQHIKLSNALEIYRLEYGSYPQTLKALVDKNILKPKDLTFPYGSEYYYRVENNKYILIVPKYIAK
ncbi:MAG: DUF4388 domain-containing protein [bacterium]